MTARFLRFWLACELALYLLLGFGLVRFSGAAPGEVAALALVLALAGRAFVIGLTFGFARAYPSMPPAGLRIGFGRAIRMALEEYVAFVALFSLLMPLERLFMGNERLPRPTAGRPPVLLIHGYQCNRGFWLWMRRRLERAGWSVATLSLEPLFGDIDGYAEQVAGRIDAVCAATGASQVILVAHSMGGLVARAYLRRFGNARVARLATLGSPHRGSELARFAMGENGRQMRPGSEWLAALNAPLAVPLPAAVISIYSCHDNYVMPQANAVLEGAVNLPVPGVGHLAMAFSPKIASVLEKELDKA